MRTHTFVCESQLNIRIVDFDPWKPPGETGTAVKVHLAKGVGTRPSSHGKKLEIMVLL
jgi:hypothetical protein